MYDFEFEIEPADCLILGWPVTVHIIYRATRTQDDHGRFGWDLTCISSKITCQGQRMELFGHINSKMDLVIEESMREHFEEQNVSAA